MKMAVPILSANGSCTHYPSRFKLGCTGFSRRFSSAFWIRPHRCRLSRASNRIALSALQHFRACKLKGCAKCVLARRQQAALTQCGQGRTDLSWCRCATQCLRETLGGPSTAAGRCMRRPRGEAESRRPHAAAPDARALQAHPRHALVRRLQVPAPARGFIDRG